MLQGWIQRCGGGKGDIGEERGCGNGRCEWSANIYGGMVVMRRIK